MEVITRFGTPIPIVVATSLEQRLRCRAASGDAPGQLSLGRQFLEGLATVL